MAAMCVCCEFSWEAASLGLPTGPGPETQAECVTRATNTQTGKACVSERERAKESQAAMRYEVALAEAL